MRGHGSQWISYKINFRHPGQLKKWKSWEPFWSYQLNSTANPAHLPQIWPNIEVNGLDWQCCLAGSSKRAPRIFIFSIVLGAENLSYMKFIETHARAFLALIILTIGNVCVLIYNLFYFRPKKWNRLSATLTRIYVKDKKMRDWRLSLLGLIPTNLW